MTDCCNEEPKPEATQLRLFTRTSLVEAFEINDNDSPSTNMMVRVIEDYPIKLPLPVEPTTADWVIIPKDVFDQYYKEVLEFDSSSPSFLLTTETRFMSANLSGGNEIAEFFQEPFIGDALYSSELTASAAPGEDEMFALGNNIVQKFIARIPEMLVKFGPGILSGVFTIETVLWGAEVAFNFAIGKLPFHLPESIKTKLWDMVEMAIRAAWEANNAGSAAPA